MRSRRRIRTAALAVALTLAACTTTRVPVPYPVPCISADRVPVQPAWLSDSLPEDATAAEIVLAVGADLEVADRYIATLTAVLESCTDD